MPYFKEGRVTVYRREIPNLPDGLGVFHALFSDAPYHITDPSARARSKEKDNPLRSFFGVSVVEDARDTYSGFVEDGISFRVEVDPLVVSMWRVEFDNEVLVREEEVAGECACVVNEDVLVNKRDPEIQKSLHCGNLGLWVRKGVSGSIRNGTKSSQRGDSSLRIDVRLRDDSLSEPNGSAGVVAGGATEIRAVLTLDKASATGKLLPAESAGEFDCFGEIFSSKLIRAITRARSLATPPEPCGIGNVRPAAYQTFTFDLRAHEITSDPIIPRKGMMGKEWDGGDIAFRPETWALFQDLLLPGAFGLAYAGSRGWHRQAVAIEDAGYIFHPSIFLAWIQGQGFPKATRIDTQVDRDAGAERESCGFAPLTRGRVSGVHRESNSLGSGWSGEQSNAATPLARIWEPYRYGLQALAPSVEPVMMFQRPYGGRPVDVITGSGAGALNIGGARIPRGEEEKRAIRRQGRGQTWDGESCGFHNDADGLASASPDGGWPANLVLHHNIDCTEEACSPGCPVMVIGEQSGILKTHGTGTQAPCECTERTGRGGLFGRIAGQRAYGSDEGTASRFFQNCGWEHELFEWFRYQAKPARAEKEAGLDALPAKKGFEAVDRKEGSAGLQSPRAGAGRTAEEIRNTHPTIKSISLSKWLATLLLPPKEYAPRRLIVPFSGAGSEIIGAMLAGWDEIVGIEMEEEYCEIAAHRVRFWQDVFDSTGHTEVQALMRAGEKRKKDREAYGDWSLL